jgi:hypothetical protein
MKEEWSMADKKAGQAGEKGMRGLPIARNEDVEFSETLADADDKEAEQRAAQADARAEQA